MKAFYLSFLFCLLHFSASAQIDPLSFRIGLLDMTTTQIDFGQPNGVYASPNGIFFTTGESNGISEIYYYADGKARRIKRNDSGSFGRYEYFFVTSFNGGTLIIEKYTSSGSLSRTYFYDEANETYVELTDLAGGVYDNYFPYQDGLFVQTGNARLVFTNGKPSGTRVLGANNMFSEGTFFPYESQVVFYAGREFYLTDGTTAGTQVLSSFSSNGSNGRYLVGDDYFYTLSDDLWKFDLTTNSSVQLTGNGVPAGDVASDISFLAPTSGGIQFIAQSGNAGREIWYSDGTPTGTTPLDLLVGPASFVGDGNSFFQHDGRIYFIGGENGASVFASDGTTEGLLELTDLSVLASGRWNLKPLYRSENGDLYLLAEHTNTNTFYLFTKPAEADNATLAGSFTSPFSISPETVKTEEGVYFHLSSHLYFASTTANSLTDIGEVDFERFIGVAGNKAIFVAGNGETVPVFRDLEPFAASSTPGSITALGDLSPSLASSAPRRLFEENGRLYFHAYSSSTFNAIYATDGTPEGTTLDTDIYLRFAGAPVSDLTTAAGRIFYFYRGEFWSSAGTEESSQSLQTENLNWQLFGENADTAYFFATPLLDVKMLRSNGTAAGTEILDFSVNNQEIIRTSKPAFYGNKIYQWVVERTAAGTYMRKLVAYNSHNLAVSDEYLATGVSETSSVGSIIVSNGGIYATRRNADGTDELFFLDVDQGTPSLIDTDAGDPGIFFVNLYSSENNLVYQKYFGQTTSLFTLDAARNPVELTSIISGETPAGIFDFPGYALLATERQIIRINGDGSFETILNGASLSNFTKFSENRLLFSRPGSFTRSTWITDGTSAGTTFFWDFGPDDNTTAPYAFIPPYLLMRETSLGSTSLVLYNYEADKFAFVQQPDPVQYFPGFPITYQGRFYFSSIDPLYGQELHYLDVGQTADATVIAYHDLNENGIKDTDEPGINNLSFTATASSDSERVFTNSSGKANFFLAAETQYTIEAGLSDCWELISPPANSQIESSPLEIPELLYGYKLTSSEADLSVLLTSAQPRCGFTVPFWLSVRNTGCTELSGNTTLTLPAGVSLVAAEGAPSITDSIISWDFSTFAPQEVFQVKLYLSMPDERSNGQVIPIKAVATSQDANGSPIASGIFDYAQILSCAIDPNDKQVLPARVEPSNSNYTQIDEKLIYTIRFQNTGTDTAFNVLVEDQLPTRLDYASFKPITASHDYRASIEGRDVSFFFENIMLPDSNVNEPLSHGFATFEIQLEQPRAIGALIRNEAKIYFDYNQAIVTNQVRSRIVEFLDEDEDGFLFYEECDDQNPDINPSGFDIGGNGIDENCDGEDAPVSTTTPLSGSLSIAPNPTTGDLSLQFSDDRLLHVQLYDLLGRKLLATSFQRSAQLDIAEFPSGAYLLKVVDSSRGQVSTRRIIRR